VQREQAQGIYGGDGHAVLVLAEVFHEREIVDRRARLAYAVVDGIARPEGLDGVDREVLHRVWDAQVLQKQQPWRCSPAIRCSTL
jgi:hypothetical protein